MVNDMETIGILGGTFNPIHLGHLQIAICAHEQFNIPHILVMPSGQPSSYKDTSIIADSSDRCAMIELAIKDYPYMSLSTIEIDRQGTTYTSDTLKYLKNDNSYIYFLIGADSLFSLDKWHEAAYVMNNCHFIAANRDKHSTDELEQKAEYLRTHYNARIDILHMNDMPISSSDIRDRIHNGKNVDNMLPDTVYQYITAHNLYM